MRKVLVFLMSVLISVSLYSCGGGGGGGSSSSSTGSTSSTPTVSNAPITVSDVGYRTSDGQSTVSEANPPNTITFNFNVYTKAQSYDVDIYLSRNNSVDNNTNDYELYSTELSNANTTATITLNKDDLAFKNLLSLYGGRYYIKVRAITPDGYEAWAVSSQPIILKKIWTFAIYMDADNSLSGEADTNLQELENIGSDRNVNIVVEVDKQDTPARRYFVEKGSLFKIQDLGEVDMASVSTLESFEKWVRENFPADHYFLDIWDHGGGFERSLTGKTLSRDLLQDDNAGVAGQEDLMTIPAFATALDNMSQAIGKKIDIVGLDACVMSMVEVAYQLRHSTNILVSSESEILAGGFPYSTIAGDLEDNVSSNYNVTPETIASMVVNDFVAYYQQITYATLSAVKLSKMDNLTASVNALAESILNNWDNDTVVEDIKNNVFNDVKRFLVYYTYNDYSCADLGDLANILYEDDNMTSDIKSSALSVLQNLKSAVIANGYYGYGYNSTTVTGLTIWLPDYNTFTREAQHYQELDFAKDTKWYDFLYQLEQ